jgi:hypothetical protein
MGTCALGRHDGPFAGQYDLLQRRGCARNQSMKLAWSFLRIDRSRQSRSNQEERQKLGR